MRGDKMDILLERKSVRKYTTEDVKKEDLGYILKAGLAAPTARNSRCVSFLVIKDKETHRKLAAIHQAAQMVLQAPLAILVVGDKNLVYQKYLSQDCAAATENLLLAATAKSYGSVWCGIYSNKERSEAIEKLLNLPENIKAFALVVIGKSNDNNPPKDKWDSSKIKYEIWK
jgi:nitroreductase